jgi:hypothetical protein
MKNVNIDINYQEVPFFYPLKATEPKHCID